MLFETMELQEYRALDPVVPDDSTTLILMSMPGDRSIRENFYFADEDERFWPLLGMVYHMPCTTREEQMEILKRHHLALWSVVGSCLRYDSREDTMQDIVLNDIPAFLKKYPLIRKIICISHDTMRLLKEADPAAAAQAVYVPSTSASDLWYDSVEKLVPEYAGALLGRADFSGQGVR